MLGGIFGWHNGSAMGAGNVFGFSISVTDVAGFFAKYVLSAFAPVSSQPSITATGIAYINVYRPTPNQLGIATRARIFISFHTANPFYMSLRYRNPVITVS
jgi:hypothetical protein